MAKTLNLGKVGITTGGVYDSSRGYSKLTSVYYGGAGWLSRKDVPAGIIPGTNDAYWQKMSERGQKGDTGERGPQGNSAFDGNGVEIVNNLTQGGEAAALSAEQGRILDHSLRDTQECTGIYEYPAFVTSRTYNVGDIVVYQGLLYKFIAQHPAGAWVDSDAVRTSVKQETDSKLTELEAEIDVIIGVESRKEALSANLVIELDYLKTDNHIQYKIIPSGEYTSFLVATMDSSNSIVQNIGNAITDVNEWISVTLNADADKFYVYSNSGSSNFSVIVRYYGVLPTIDRLNENLSVVEKTINESVSQSVSGVQALFPVKFLINGNEVEYKITPLTSYTSFLVATMDSSNSIVQNIGNAITDVNEWISVTLNADADKFYVYSNSGSGNFSVEVRMKSCIFSQLQSLEDGKVNVPRFSITDNNILNERIKELYFPNMDKSKYYYVYAFGKSSYDTYRFYVAVSDSQSTAGVSPVSIYAYYDSATMPNGIIPLRRDGAGIVGYAMINMLESDSLVGIGNKSEINVDTCSDILYNLAIKDYLNAKGDGYKNIVSINESIPLNRKIDNYPLLNIELTESMLYVRTEYDSQRDILLQFRLSGANNAFAASKVWIGDNSLSNEAIRENGNLFHDAYDSNAPLPTANFGYLGGNHGYAIIRVVSTGKTRDDIGSRYYTSNGEFELVDVNESDGYMWLAPVVVDADDKTPYPHLLWDRANPGNTFTYISGGISTTDIVATSVTYGNDAQYYRSTMRTRMLIELDGDVISVGNHTGKHLVVYEEYNVKDVSTVKEYTPQMIGESLGKFTLTWEFVGSTYILHSDFLAEKDIYLMYFTPIQPVGLKDLNGNNAFFILPKTTQYNDMTSVANVAQTDYYRNEDDLIDVMQLPERAIWGYKDGDGNIISAYAAGSSIQHGDGKNDVRIQNVPVGDRVYNINKSGTWCKFYPRQSENGKMKSGQHIGWLSYFSYFLPTNDVLEYEVIESDVRVRYIHLCEDVSDVQIDFSRYKELNILERYKVDYDIIDNNVMTYAGEKGGYIVISLVA